MAHRLKDDESMALDREAAVAALSILAPLLQRLPDAVDAEDLARRLSPTSGELAAEAIDTWDDGDGAVNFVQALLMLTVLRDQLEPLGSMTT